MIGRRIFLIAVVLVVLGPMMTEHASAATYVGGTLWNIDLYTRSGAADSVVFIISGASAVDWHYSAYAPYGAADTCRMKTDVIGGKLRVSFKRLAGPFPGDSVHVGLGWKYPLQPRIDTAYWSNGTGIKSVDANWTGQGGIFPDHMSVALARTAIPPPPLDSLKLVNVKWAAWRDVAPIETMLPWYHGHDAVWQPAASLEGAWLRTKADSARFTTDQITYGAVYGALVKFDLLDNNNVLLGRYEFQAEVSPASYPTLTEWGLIILGILLTAGVVWTYVRRRRVLVTA